MSLGVKQREQIRNLVHEYEEARHQRMASEGTTVQELMAPKQFQPVSTREKTAWEALTAVGADALEQYLMDIEAEGPINAFAKTLYQQLIQAARAAEQGEGGIL